MKVQAKPESILASTSNIQVSEALSNEQDILFRRDEFDLHHAAPCLSAEQNIQALSLKANESIKFDANPSDQYTQSVRKKFLLLFSMIAVSAKQQQASSKKDFFQQLSDHLKSSKPIEKRVQIGIDFACQFQLSLLQQTLSEEAKIEILKKIYEILKEANDGDLFGHDKFSFIIDSNLDCLSIYLQNLVSSSSLLALSSICLKILMQLGRVRSNPANYLACINARVENSKLIKVDLSEDMGHILTELSNFSVKSQKDQGDEKSQIIIPMDFKEIHSLNRGTLFYYKAGVNKLDITSLDNLATDGHNMYHLKRGKGLFKLGFGDGIEKISGFVKDSNTSEAIKSMESTSMVLIQDKLYIRHYNIKPYPFEVYDSKTLQIDQELTDKIKVKFERTLKQLEIKNTGNQAPDENVALVTHRSLLWHKDSKSGRTLEITPLFTDGNFLYCVAFQKQQISDRSIQILVVEQYNIKNGDFDFVKHIPLLNKEGTDPFVYDSNSLNFLRSSQWLTNGQVLGLNVPNLAIYFFDLMTGCLVAEEKSENILMCHDLQTNKIFGIKSLQGTHQTLFEVAYNGFKKNQQSDAGEDTSAQFSQVESQQISDLIAVSKIRPNGSQKVIDNLIESIVYGQYKHQNVQTLQVQEASEQVISAQHTLILKYLDVKRAQATLKLPHLDFINIFKYPNVTYLSGSTFSALIKTASQQQIQPIDLLYALRLLQCNFTALTMCQGSLPEIMRDYQDYYKRFFDLYNDVLRKKVYEKPANLVEAEIKRVCIEIMSSSINILYENNQEIVNKFLSELKENSTGINCNIFFDYFSQVENFQKLLSHEIFGAIEIFEVTSQVQLEYVINQINGQKIIKAQDTEKSDLASCRFFKVFSYHTIISYCNLLEKVAERQKSQQKVPQALLEKYREEDNRLKNLQNLTFTVYRTLNSCFKKIIEVLKTLNIPKEKEQAVQYLKKIKRVLLQKSPFAQMYLNVYCQIFTVLNLELHLLPEVFQSSLEVIALIKDLSTLINNGTFTEFYTELAQEDNPFNFLCEFNRTLSYLVASKAYIMTGSQPKITIQNTIETQLLQSNVLSGGIDPSFESDFSQETLKQISHYTQITGMQLATQHNNDYEKLESIIEPKEGSEVSKALDILQKAYTKDKGLALALIGREAGFRLTRAAFAVLLKLQDQLEAFNQLVEIQDLELLEQKEKEVLCSLFSIASQMRKWTHEAKNTLSERIDADVESKHRKEKEQRQQATSQVKKQNEPVEVQIDTTGTLQESENIQASSSDKFFTQNELDAIKQEQEKTFSNEIAQIYDSVVEKAKYLIKIQAPSLTFKSNLQKVQINDQSDLLSNWKESQKEMGNIKSLSSKEKEIRITCSGEVLTILQLSSSVQRIQKQVEEVYVAAYRRVAGLYVFSQLVDQLTPKWSQKAFQDSLTWFCAALRDNKNQQVHYLQGLTGCGITLEAQAREYFFRVLRQVVEKLKLESNSEQDISFLISCLKWKYLGRDHDALSDLRLFSTIYQSQRLKIYWGKPVTTDFVSKSNQSLQFDFLPTTDNQAMIKSIFDRHDGHKSGVLNYAEAKEFLKELCNQFGQAWDQNDPQFDQMFNKIQKDNRVNFDTLYKKIQLKKTTSQLSEEILSTFEILFSSSITRLIESDFGASIKLSSQSPAQLSKAKSVVNQNKSDLLLGEMFEVIFQELNRYLSILNIAKGIDWTIYAQKRSVFIELFDVSVDTFELLDKKQDLQNIIPASLVEIAASDNDEERKAKEILIEQAKVEEKQKQNLKMIPRLYSESFLMRLLRLVLVFTSVSAAANHNLLVIIQRIANPNQLALLLSLLVLGSPKIKFSILKIFQNLVKIEFPVELFEETIKIHLNQSESSVSQILRKIQPTIQFKKSNFLAFIHHYILSIRQKLWTKSSIESESQYEVSCELLKFMRTLYESCKSTQHPWRIEIDEVIVQTLADQRKMQRPRETEVILGLIRGADFNAIAPQQQVSLKGKDSFTVLGFVNRDWLKRNPNTPKQNILINQTMTDQEQKVLLVSDQNKGELFKLVNPERLSLQSSSKPEDQQQFKFTAQLLKSIFDSTDLASGSSDDIQQLSNKCLILKLIDNQLTTQPKEFIACLRSSGHYETLFKLVGKESSLETKGDIVLLGWLEQLCYNIRKQACENQLCLLKPQEARMSLVKDKIYAFAIDPNSKGEKSYVRIKLQSALNYGGFAQRKEIKLINSSDMQINDEQESQNNEQLVTLLDCNELQEEQGLDILNRSFGIITHSTDLHSLMKNMTIKYREDAEKYPDIMAKSVFLVTPEDFTKLAAVCSGGSNTQKSENQDKEKTFDEVYQEELMQYGGLSQVVASKTKFAQGVENKTKTLFNVLEQINSGQIIQKDEEQSQDQSDVLRRNKPVEDTYEIQSQLIQRYQEYRDRAHPDQTRSSASTFFKTTKVENDSDLADLYEKSIRKLFNKLCRNIFWNMIQKDKIVKIFDFLLTKPEDMRAFVTFFKVIGNEGYVTANKQSIKSFNQFVKQVVQASLSTPKFQQLLQMMIDDLIESYRGALPDLLDKHQYISVTFRTESQAGKLMNPFIVIPLLKYLLKQNDGFNLIKDRVGHLISILIAMNCTFIGDYKLKEKYWFYITALLDKSQELDEQQIEHILRLQIVKALFQSFEQNHTGTQSGTQRLQRIYLEDNSSEVDGIPRNQPWKILNQGREQRQRRMIQYQNRSSDHLLLLEVLFKFYQLSLKVPRVSFFFSNTLTRFLQTQGSLLEQGPAGELSRHLLITSQIPQDKKIVNIKSTLDFASQPGPHLIQCTESTKFLVHITESTVLKPGHQILLSSDKDGKSEVALFNQKQIKTSSAFETVYSEQVYLNVVFPKQNFVVRLSQNELQPENLEFRIEGTILNSYQNRMFLTEDGIFKVHSQDLVTPEKDHLVMSQATFGKNCTVALLPNGSIVGYGQSKHRHFLNKTSRTTSESENVIPLNQKPLTEAETANLSKEELAQQRQVVKIRTFKRTSICLTASGHVYAVGDKFARQIKLPADAFKSFGFYLLPVSTQVLVKEEEKKQESQAEAETEENVENKVQDSVLGQIFGEAEQEQPVEELKQADEQPVQQSEEQPVSQVNQETKSVVSDDDYKSVQSQEAKPNVLQPIEQPSQPVAESAIETNEVELEVKSAEEAPAEEEKDLQGSDDQDNEEGSEYVPKEEGDDDNASKKNEQQEIIAPAAPTYTAVDLWISETSSSKHIVVLVLFKSTTGAFEFRTIGNNPNGLLGQGKDKKQSVELQRIDFGIELQQIEEVVVGYQHFIVRADGKVYAWGCYNSDSEEKIIWQPRELVFFQSHKIKKMVSGDMFTCVLVEQVGQPDYFICGKFTPLWQENQYKSLKYFVDFQIDNFHLQGQNLFVSTKAKNIEDFLDVKIDYSLTPDCTFRPSEKLKAANQEIFDKYQALLALEKPELQGKLLNLIESQIYPRVKDHDFDQVQWQDINLDELKIDETFGLNDEQKRAWLLLVVNYCKHIWAYLSVIGGQFKRTDYLPIYQNFIKYRKNIPMCLKNKYLKILLQDMSKDDKGNSIHIYRKRALELRKEGQVDTKGEWTVFAQVSKELRKNKFHGMHINSQNKRAWFVKFIGEAALDDGGLFRESITELCSELQSTALELFIPCANQTSKIGDNRDKWVINPQALSDMHLKMFEFVGSLFGMSVRSGILLNLNLAPIFWKTLTRDSLTINDIRDVDLKFVQNLETYAKCKKEGVPEEQFRKDHELTMTCLNSAQKVIDLVSKGSKKEVTYQNLETYIQKCIDLRLSEAREQYKAILKGFDQTFNTSFLKVLSWQDLELKVVGNEEVDIERLKEITTYSKCSATHEVIKKFWKVLSSFENEDKKRYLRFVWGRTRLPLKEDTDIELHTILLDENRAKTDTPFGRTCYFRLELPPYQSEAVLRERLLFAITNCTSIDGDYERNYNVEESLQHQPPLQAERERVDGSDSEQERLQDEERQRLRERHNDYGSEGSGNEDNQDDNGEEEVEEEE